VQQSVEHTNAIAVLEQLVDDDRPDVSGPSGYQDVFGHVGQEDRLRRARGREIGLESLGLADWSP
jgi:hypothetical protein